MRSWDIPFFQLYEACKFHSFKTALDYSSLYITVQFHFNACLMP